MPHGCTMAARPYRREWINPVSLQNETHAPELRSWVASANQPNTDFPIQNLPFSVFRRKGANEVFRGGIAIGDQILDLGAAASSGAFTGEAETAARAAAHETLNAFMALGPVTWSALVGGWLRGMPRGCVAGADLRVLFRYPLRSRSAQWLFRSR